MLINAVMDQSKSPIRFKAPRGRMYEIFDIHFSVLTAGANNVLVFNYLLEDQVQNVLGTETGNTLAVMSAAIGGQAEDFTFTKGEKTKFISISRSGGTTMAVWIIIHYELIIASKTELIWEWFTKGR